MNIKKSIVAFASLLLAYSAFDLIQGWDTGRAMGETGQGLFIPRIDDDWGNEGWASRTRRDYTRRSARHPSTAPDKQADKQADQGAQAGESESKGSEVTAAEVIRLVLPWFSGTLGLCGFGLVAYSAVARRRLRKNRTRRARGVHFGRGGKAPTQTELAFRLANAPAPKKPAALPTAQEAEQDQQPLRRAA